MFMVDRRSFILWTQGILLNRKGNQVEVGDGRRNEEAEERMNKGETIGLLVNGELVSTMKLEHGGYQETK